MIRTLFLVLAAVVSLLAGDRLAWAQSGGGQSELIQVRNVATLSFEKDGQRIDIPSNEVVIDLVDRLRTPATILLLREHRGNGGLPIPPSGGQCLSASGDFQPTDLAGSGRGSIRATGLTSLTLLPVVSYRPGDPVYISVEDLDQNADSDAVEAIDVRVETSQGDQEQLRLFETGPDTGRFIGAVATTDEVPPTANDCQLLLQRDDRLTVFYRDREDDEDRAEAVALVDPLGLVFDSVTGVVLDGAEVTLIDEATGQPAQVFGEDGISAYPSTVITGDAVTDASGDVYPGVSGGFRFPLVRPGTYRLLILPPGEYAHPSRALPSQIAKLTTPDGNDFTIGDGSYGQSFVVTGPAPVRVDIPVDPPTPGNVILQKQVSDELVEAGDFVQYRLILDNRDPVARSGLIIVDTPPTGFRFVGGSARSQGERLADPAPAADGRSLRFAVPDLPAGGSIDLTYILAVASNAPDGDAVNRAITFDGDLVVSNPALAELRVRRPFFTDSATLIGRVTEGECSVSSAERPGVADVRILMEDGRYVITDSDGLYHFEGVHPGTHVVQLDVGALPDGFEAIACERSSRRAGRAFSSFVEVQGGALWRTDFVLQRTGDVAAEGKEDDSVLSDAEAAGSDRDWLAGQGPGTDILFPDVGHNPRSPAQKVAVKHAAGDEVALTINGTPVDPLAFDGAIGNEDGSVKVSRWRGIRLENGRNELRATVTGADGKQTVLTREIHYTTRAARAELITAQSHLIADGRTRPVLAIRLTDASGRPVHHGVTGSFNVDTPYRAAIAVDNEQARQLAGLEAYAPTWRVQGDDGIALIELDPTGQTGEARLVFTFQGKERAFEQDVETWLKPGDQDMVVVGFAAGTAGFNTISTNARALLDNEADEAFADGEVKLYAKGRVLGEWLMTLAIDSEKPERRDGRRALLQTIDPDRLYTVYGDGSEQRFDAPTSDRLYLKLERAQFYAMYGDFETGLTETELTRYSRTLTGVKSEYRGDVFDFNGFVADTGLTFGRAEIQGSGLSGPYRLGARNLVINSEKILIETRDRFRSDVILSSEPQTRHIDYDVDAVTGTIRFRRPIASRDANFNPIFIVADFETEGVVEKKLNAGGRAAARIGETIELGASFLRDSDQSAKTDLYGADLIWKPRADTEIRAEYARSSANIRDFGKSDGTAWLIEGEHHGRTVDARAYVREQEAGFGVGQQNDAETGTRKYGVDASVRLADGLAATISGYREDYLIGPARREALSAKAEWAKGGTTLEAGYRFVDDRGRDGLHRRSQLATFGGTQALAGGKVTVEATAEVPLDGDDESVDYPARYRAGLSWQLNAKVRVVAAHELAKGETFEANNTELGFELLPWTGANLTATLNQSGIKEYGPRTFAALGLQQKLLLDERWSVDVAVDANNTLSGAIDPNGILNPAQPAASGGFLGGQGQLTEDFWAVSTGATYRTPTLSWNGRLEYRDGDSRRYGATTSVLRQTTAGIALAGQASIHRITSQTGGTTGIDGQDGTSANVRLSGAWRPLGSRWAVLDRLEFDLQDVSSGQLPGPFVGLGGFGPDGGTSRRIVNNLAVNRMSGVWTGKDDEAREGRTQMSLYWGTKYVFDRYQGEDYDGFAQAVALDLRHDVSDSVDVGVAASLRHVASGPDNFSYSVGPHVGLSPITNAWLSVGYNVAGYHDEDFSEARYTRDGPYVTFRLKLDQLSPEALFGGR
ncbi:MAG: hypothetical protein WA906_05500 [Pacificimonas sp.]